MPDASRAVFLSYRREVSWQLAHAVRGELVGHGFDVFMDTADLDSGEFERVILTQIEARPHFLLLVEARSFDRITEPDDWLRREITHALRHDRNIVPLLAGGCRLPRAAELPADVARLPSFNAVSVPHDYFTEAMQKLRERFLKPRTPPELDPATPKPPLASLPVLRRRPTLEGVPIQMGAQLTWSILATVERFELERSPSPYFHHPVQVFSGPQRSYIDERPPRPTAHYRVRAFLDGAAGEWSNVVEVRTDIVAPISVRRPIDAPPVLSGTPDGRSYCLSWTRVPLAVGYEVTMVNTFFGDHSIPVYRGPELTTVLEESGPMGLEPPSVRVRALDQHGRPITDWSQPLRLR
jgi:hypothetical protein